MSKRIKTPQSQGRDYKQMLKHIETMRRELGFSLSEYYKGKNNNI